MYSLYHFETRGLGVVSNQPIPKGTYIGNYFSKSEPITLHSRVIYDGWVETNPLGRYINHKQYSNLDFVMKEDVIELYANQDIKDFKELTVDYISMIELIKLPKELVEKYNIQNFDYIEEYIEIKKQII